MAFDCYCAICGVGFSVRVESASESSPERRRRWVERRSQALQRGEDIPLNSTCDEDGELVSSYDPQLVDTKSLEWSSQVHCLGMNVDDKGNSRAFLSGPGYYADAGELAVKVGQTLKRTYFNCYGFGTDEVPGPVMPFHWCCFEILLRALTGTTEPKNVDLNKLYHAMMKLCNGSGSALRLAYGPDVLRAQGQYWHCIPGAEYCVKHPVSTPGLDQLLQTQLKTNKRFQNRFAELHLGDRQPKNPFGRLPAEIVYQICSFLSGSSLKALIQASLFVHLLTQDNYFWKCFIQSDMPWFWETEMFRKLSDLPAEMNYKLVYLWLNEVTVPKYGMEGVFMGVANRRRIWSACEELSVGYFESLKYSQVK